MGANSSPEHSRMTPCPAAGRTPRASPPGHTAWHPFSARTPTYHSCAIIKADERGLADALSSEFDPAPDVLASVLTYCDMTTSPDGQPVPVERRLAEIQHRHGSGHLVSRSIQRATPMILSAVEQVHQRAAQTT